MPQAPRQHIAASPSKASTNTRIHHTSPHTPSTLSVTPAQTLLPNNPAGPNSHGKSAPCLPRAHHPTNTFTRARINPGSEAPAVLPAHPATTRIRKARRRTSRATNHHRSRPPASAAARRRPRARTPPRSSPLSTRLRDVSCGTYECSECTTTCYWKRSLWRTRNSYGKLRRRPRRRRRVRVEIAMRWTEMRMRGAEWMICEVRRWVLVTWKS